MNFITSNGKFSLPISESMSVLKKYLTDFRNQVDLANGDTIPRVEVVKVLDDLMENFGPLKNAEDCLIIMAGPGKKQEENPSTTTASVT